MTELERLIIDFVQTNKIKNYWRHEKNGKHCEYADEDVSACLETDDQTCNTCRNKFVAAKTFRSISRKANAIYRRITRLVDKMEIQNDSNGTDRNVEEV